MSVWNEVADQSKGVGPPAPPSPRLAMPRTLRRVGRALRVDASLFREARDDPALLGLGLVLVALGGVARGIGDWTTGGFVGFAAGVVLAFLVWLLGSGAATLFGRWFAGADASYVAVLRTCAFAAAPALLLVFRAVPAPPSVQGAIWILAHGALLLGFVIAVREGLRVTTTQALLLTAMTLALGFLPLLFYGYAVARLSTL